MAFFLLYFIKRYSDQALWIGFLTIIALVFLGWYIFFYQSLKNETATVFEQKKHIVKRISSLKKRLATLSKKASENKQLYAFITTQFLPLPKNSKEAQKLFLNHVEKTGTILRVWKPKSKRVHYALIEQDVALVLEGTFEHIYTLLAQNYCIIKSCSLLKADVMHRADLVLTLVSRKDA